jgi:hypothetical protein
VLKYSDGLHRHIHIEMDFFGHLIFGHDLSICYQNQAEDETKDVKFLVWEPLTIEVGKGKPQPKEKRKEKRWKTTEKPFQATIKEGQWEDEERYWEVV